MTDVEIKQALSDTFAALKSENDNPELDARILVAHSLGKPQSYLYAWPEKTLTVQQLNHLHKLVLARQEGVPVAYLTGIREFWSLPLRVTEDVLIPRPATESLVAKALQRLPEKPLRVADLGTGSGAIALALASERPAWQITAIDISEDALMVAKNNATNLGLKNIEFQSADWCKKLLPQDAIISNPPYIASDDPHLQNTDIEHEPILALASGEDGLDAIRKISENAKHCLANDGMLMLEHGYDQQSRVLEILAKQGYQRISGHKDSEQLPRFTVAYAP